jgi:hypothetical protein
MPFVDTNDGVFPSEKSFATWHEALDRYETFPVHKNPTWRAVHKELFAQMWEYLTAAKIFDGDVLLHHPLCFLFPKS